MNRGEEEVEKEREEEEWCTNCMWYGHEEHHCLEVFQDTDLEWEEPECPAPEWEERPLPKRGEAEHLQPTSPPAEGEYLLVPSPPPPTTGVEQQVLPLSPPPPPAEGACLLVSPLQPEGEEPLPPTQPEGEDRQQT
ncbi:UNVERIFIED_CONTAM: hypothetical protein FKN15_009015 [Acipenser sinensis]